MAGGGADVASRTRSSHKLLICSGLPGVTAGQPGPSKRVGGENMLSKLRLPALALGAALLFAPTSVQARERERVHHHHRFSVFVGVSPRHYADGYYDRWGYWHPYRAGF